jgi:hypothetical protein
MAAKEKKKTKSKTTDREQSERFEKAARDLGIEEHEAAKAFERAFSKIVPAKKSDRV